MDPAVQEATMLIRQIYGIVDRLEGLFPGRHFTPDGHMVGSIGEVLAAARYGLELLPASAPLHDGRTADGKLVQVKATQSNRIAFRGAESPEHLIVLSLNSDGTATEEYNGPGHSPWGLAGAVQSNGQRPLGLARLRSLMANIDPNQRIEEVSPNEPVISNPNMTCQDLEGILFSIVDRCMGLVSQGRRDALLNERFFHHMFSWDVARWYGERGLNIWDHLLLAPECPTAKKFRRAGIDLADEAATALNAIGNGRSGNFDFVIRTSPRICVEWKGPDLWQPQEVVEVLLKLLTEPDPTIKVFAGILTSSSTGKYGHVETAVKYFREAVESVKKILGVPSLDGADIFAFLATLSDSGIVKIHWGPIKDDSTEAAVMLTDQ